MKRIVILGLVALWSVGLVRADGFTAANGISYNILTGTQNVEVTAGTDKYTGVVVIPSSVVNDGTTYTVTAIGRDAFSGCADLTSVTIPETVTSIGNSAFVSCSGLSSVTIPDAVTSIGNSAFYHCRGLKSVTIGNSVEAIEEYTFEECHSLMSVTLPDAVTSIGERAFFGCRGLRSVTIGSAVSTIGQSAFKNCSGLETITIPEAVTSIGSDAFSGCSGLTSVTIPNSVTTIGKWAFYQCNGLTSLYYTGDIAQWCAISKGENWMQRGYDLYINEQKVTDLVIPETVTSIGDGAFLYCGGLTSVTIGNAVTSIGSSAFEHCGSLTSVEIPNSVTSIGHGAFKYCFGLRSVTIGRSVTSFGTWIFYSCSNLEKIYTYATVPPTLGSDVFDGVEIANIHLYVPQGSVADYQDAEIWKGFQIAPFFTVTVSANDGSVGTVTGGGIYGAGETARLTAMPTAGYGFVQWSDGETANPRTVTVTSDSAFVAEFAKDIYTVTVSVNDASMGSVTGGGSYESGATATLTATPNTGCKFVKWSDGETANPRTVTVTSDSTFVAEFAKEIYTVTVSSNDESMGTVTGGGEFESGATATLTATPKAGHKFVKWSDGATANPRTLTVTSDTTFKAEFAKETYTVTVSANDESMGTVTGGGEFESGTTATLTATPKAGCKFVKWNDGETANPRTLTVTSDTTFKAEFAKDIYTVTVSVNDATMGSVTGGGEFESGATATLIATPNTGCKFVKWSDGETANPRTVTVTSNLTFVAEFAKENVAIEDLSGRDRMTVTSAQGTIYVRGAEGVPVSVYDMFGICLFRENGRALTEVAVPSIGIYIVKVGAQTVKIAVR